MNKEKPTALDIFNKAYSKSILFEKRFQKPGAIIELLSPEDRAILETLTSKDIQNIRVEPYEIRLTDDKLISNLKCKFDRNLVK